MSRVLLVAGFVLALLTLGFAAANAGVPQAPGSTLVDGRLMAVDYD